MVLKRGPMFKFEHNLVLNTSIGEVGFNTVFGA